MRQFAGRAAEREPYGQLHRRHPYTAVQLPGSRPAFAPATADTTKTLHRAATRRRFPPEYFFVRLSVLAQIPAAKANLLHNKKAPRGTLGLIDPAFSREKRWPLRRGRVAWLTAHSADYSGGTAADSHGLPHFPCLQIGSSVYAGLLGVSMQGIGARSRNQRFFQFGLRFSTSARSPS